MTQKQKAFCDEYLKSLNASKSAVLAGYSAKTSRAISRELMTKPHIKSYISERLKKMDNIRIASLNETLETITKAMRLDLHEFPKEVLKACELMLKRYSIDDTKDNTLEIIIKKASDADENQC